MAEPQPADELSASSGAAFAAGDAKLALEILSKRQSQDPKVLHNTAIAEYVAGGCREPRKLLATLEALKQRLEDARAEEFGEGDNLGGDTDPSLALYNMAVLLYQLKQYARCRTLLEDMFSNIEPIDEFLAFKLCFLLLDVYLLQRQAERAAEVLAYLEKSFTALTKSEANGQPPTEGATAEAGGPAAAAGSEGLLWPNKRSSTRRPPTNISPDEVRASLSLYKAKLALMSRASKSSKREIKTTLNACAPTTTGLLLKCNLEWQRGNYRKAIKLLNNSCGPYAGTERDQNVPALYFNNLGCIHHCLRRHAAASFYFQKALAENAEMYAKAAAPASPKDVKPALQTFSCDRRCELSYNRGLQQLLAGRPKQAFDSFMVAIELYHSQPRAWLRIGEACVAVHVQKLGEEEQGAGVPAVSPLVAALAHGKRGSAARGLSANSASRYLVLPTAGPLGAGRDGAGPPAEEPEPAPVATIANPAPTAPTLSYGVKALRNAVLQCCVQLGPAQLSSLTAAEYGNLLAASANGSLSSVDEQTLQLHAVQRLALLHLSWCALSTGDYVPALNWASQLAGLEACPGSLKVYAHMYACDALCNLNRIDEALEQLTAALEQPEPLAPVASSTGAESPQAADGETMESVRNPYSTLGPTAAAASGLAGGGGGNARAMLYTNLAVVHILKGDPKAAEGYAQQALSLATAANPPEPPNRRTLLCCIYLELHAGRTENALELIKKQRMPAAKPAAS